MKHSSTFETVTTSSQEQFRKDGFCIVNEPKIDLHLLHRVADRIPYVLSGKFDRKESPEATNATKNGLRLQQITQLHWADRAVYELVTSKNIMRKVKEALGAKKLQVYGSQLYIKPPGKQGHTPWHRDSQYVPFFDSGYITVWVPLQPVTEQNGTLLYAKGTQNTVKFPTPEDRKAQSWEEEKEGLSNIQLSPALLPLGGFSFHHCDLIHGSDVNLTSQTRYALGIGLITENLRVTPGFHNHPYVINLYDHDKCPILLNDL